MSQATGFDRDLLEIYGELKRDRLMELVVRYARDRLEAVGSSVFLRDDITGRYVLRATTGLLESTTMPSERVEYEPGEGLTGWIVKHGRPLRIANVKDGDELSSIADDLVWTKKYSEVSAEPGLAYLGVPIFSRDGSSVLGVLRVSGKAEGEQFGEPAAELLGQVAALVSIAIENSHHYEQERRRARYFRLLLDIASELDPRRPVDKMLRRVVSQVRTGFRTEACHVFLRDEENPHRLVLRATDGAPQEIVGSMAYQVGQGLTGQIVENKARIQIREAETVRRWNDPHVAEVACHLPSGVYRSFLGVPLRLGDEIHGTLEMVNKIPSAPGHRDWFTDSDEEYLRLLATAVSSVLEGARYLKTLGDVGVTAMRMQRMAAFGTLAQRIPHEVSNPLAVARLATNNLRGDLDRAWPGDADPAVCSRVARRLDVIETALDDVGSRLLELLDFSQQVGFVRTMTGWNDVVREALIWLAGERQQRGVKSHVTYGDLPPLFIESNELFGVLVTILRLALEATDRPGALIEVSTGLTEEGRRVRTEVRVPDGAPAERLMAILDPEATPDTDASPFQFEWALARHTVEGQYDGELAGWIDQYDVVLGLEFPVKES